VHAPAQHALAEHLADPAPYLELAAFYAAKRDHFRAGLARTKLRLLPSEGTYFQCVDYSAVGSEDEATFCRRLTTQLGVAAIPLSAFYARPFEQRIVRFCYAKRTETLDAALDRLAAL
jgi:methionine aminotransferase